MPDFSLSGKVALVTGASRGIGRAIAEAYAAAGAAVVVASRRQEGVDAVAHALREAGGEALAVAAHTGHGDAVATLAARIGDAYGGLDVVVNNAATNPHFGPVLTSDEGHWDKTLDVNVKGYFRVVQACLPLLEGRGGGKVVNVASMAGRRALPGMGLYCVSKAAVLMLTEVLAVELAPRNVQVNAILPGFVKTRFSEALWADEALNAAILQATPQGRLAAPEELAGLALFLASAASDFVTGGAFPIDGGLLAASPLGS